MAIPSPYQGEGALSKNSYLKKLIKEGRAPLFIPLLREGRKSLTTPEKRPHFDYRASHFEARTLGRTTSFGISFWLFSALTLPGSKQGDFKT